MGREDFSPKTAFHGSDFWGGCCTWRGDNDQVIPREEKLYR